ncbi:MAG: hypothetical protein IH859_09050 [Chloroflexi bacterium]|nr:hypothetical protein [Chloroflexota bacterium]
MTNSLKHSRICRRAHTQMLDIFEVMGANVTGKPEITFLEEVKKIKPGG